MGQKVNPIAVRLNFNRFSDSSWFSDYYYSTLLYQDLNFRQYLSLIRQPSGNKLGFRTAKCIIHHFPKRSLIHLFCLSDPRKKDTSVNLSVPRVTPTKYQRSFNTSMEALATHSLTGPGEDYKPQTEISHYWLKSSIFQKKRALINLHRGISQSLTQICRIHQQFNNLIGAARFKELWLQKDCKKNTFETNNIITEKGFHPYRHRPGWLHRLNPPAFVLKNTTFGAPIFVQQPSQLPKLPTLNGPVLLDDDKHTDANASVPDENLTVPSTKMRDEFLNTFDKARTSIRPSYRHVNRQSYEFTSSEFATFRSYFNFYAMHYYFMQKTNMRFVQYPSWDKLSAGEQISLTSQTNALRLNLQQTSSEAEPHGIFREGTMRFKVGESQQKRKSDVLIALSGSSTELDPELNLSPTRSALTFTANVIWPTLREIQLSPNNRTRSPMAIQHSLWRLLSLVPTSGTINSHGMVSKLHSVPPLEIGVLGNSATRFACDVPAQITKSLDFYLSNVHFRLSQNTKTFISLRAVKVNSIFQCAYLVAQEVACKLEQKKSFRLICRLIFQQLAACNFIKGIRITCSGRLNGAEIAKTECRKFGETSLHVFSDKIDYARTKASTPYGILGVKVWISYI